MLFRTGSIIALHIDNDEWTSGSCFTRSQIKTLPTISRTHGFFSKWKYHPKGLQAALQTAFTDRETLVDTPNGKGPFLKAAIVAGTSGRPIVFTNYRHTAPSKSEFIVTSPDIWTLIPYFI
jgi:hypothetical protein